MAGQPPPRQPRDLEGLLKFCMQVTASEDAPAAAVQEMDPDRRRWLEEAIAGMTVDVVKQLAEAIKILGGPAAFDPEASEDDLEEIEMAFEAVDDWCGNLDMANNFHKIDGFHVLKKVLNESPHAMARACAANAAAEMAQNNPYCQENFVSDGFLPVLLNLMEKDGQELVKLKSLYAISSIVRDYPAGTKAFLDLSGADSLLRTLQSTSNPRLRAKACFFVAVVASEDDQAKAVFCQMGFARQLVAMLQFEEWDLSLHEQAARGLHTLLVANPAVQRDLVDSAELSFRTLVDKKISELESKGEAQDERDFFLAIKNMCFDQGSSPECPNR